MATKKRISQKDRRALSKPVEDVIAAEVTKLGVDPTIDPRRNDDLWGKPIKVIVRDMTHPGQSSFLPVEVSTRKGTWTRQVQTNVEIMLPERIAKSINDSANIVHETVVPPSSGLNELTFEQASEVNAKNSPGTTLARGAMGMLVQRRSAPRYIVTPVL